MSSSRDAKSLVVAGISLVAAGATVFYAMKSAEYKARESNETNEETVVERATQDRSLEIPSMDLIREELPMDPVPEEDEAGASIAPEADTVVVELESSVLSSSTQKTEISVEEASVTSTSSSKRRFGSRLGNFSFSKKKSTPEKEVSVGKGDEVSVVSTTSTTASKRSIGSRLGSFARGSFSRKNRVSARTMALLKEKNPSSESFSVNDKSASFKVNPAVEKPPVSKPKKIKTPSSPGKLSSHTKALLTKPSSSRKDTKTTMNASATKGLSSHTKALLAASSPKPDTKKSVTGTKGLSSHTKALLGQ